MTQIRLEHGGHFLLHMPDSLLGSLTLVLDRITASPSASCKGT
jgi:hypothetical protein